MSEVALYPLDSSSYTSWDGNTYDVPCTIPGVAVEVDLGYDCPDGFVPPRKGDPRNCIQVINPQLSVRSVHNRFWYFFISATCNSSQSCPVNAYTTEEYDIMWIVAGVVSIIGFILNIYMAATWFVLFSSIHSNNAVYVLKRKHDISNKRKCRGVAGRKHFKYEVRPQIRNTVFLGILYGLVDTLPMVLLPPFSSFIARSVHLLFHCFQFISSCFWNLIYLAHVKLKNGKVLCLCVSHWRHLM